MSKKLIPYKVKSLSPPAIIPKLGGKTYALLGGKWFEIPSDTKLEDLDEYWEKMYPDTPKISHKDGVWHRVSSKGTKKYKVVLKDGQFSCECPGFMFRKYCRHIDSVKEELGIETDNTSLT